MLYGEIYSYYNDLYSTWLWIIFSQFSNLEYLAQKVVFLCLCARNFFSDDQEKPDEHMKQTINNTKHLRQKQRQTKQYKHKYIIYLPDKKTWSILSI